MLSPWIALGLGSLALPPPMLRRRLNVSHMETYKHTHTHTHTTKTHKTQSRHHVASLPTKSRAAERDVKEDSFTLELAECPLKSKKLADSPLIYLLAWRDVRDFHGSAGCA